MSLEFSGTQPFFESWIGLYELYRMKLHFLAHFCWRATIHSVASQVGFAGRSAVAEATSPDPKTKVSSAGFGRLWR